MLQSQTTDKPTTCADPESCVRGGQTLTFFVLVDGMENGSKCHLKLAIIGPLAKRRFAGVPIMPLNAGLVAL